MITASPRQTSLWSDHSIACISEFESRQMIFGKSSNGWLTCKTLLKSFVRTSMVPPQVYSVYSTSNKLQTADPNYFFKLTSFDFLDLGNHEDRCGDSNQRIFVHFSSIIARWDTVEGAFQQNSLVTLVQYTPDCPITLHKLYFPSFYVHSRSVNWNEVAEPSWCS